MNWKLYLAGSTLVLLIGSAAHPWNASNHSPSEEESTSTIGKDCEEAVKQRLRNAESYKAEMVAVKPFPEGAG